MTKKYFMYYSILLMAFVFASCEKNAQTSFGTGIGSPKVQAISLHQQIELPPATSSSDSQQVTCPIPDPPPVIRPDKDLDKKDARPEEPNREVNDLATGFVNQQFFTTTGTLFNFMNLVYTSLENAMLDYESNLNLEKGSIKVLAKGGNIMRMIFQKALSLLPEDAKEILSKAYADYFKRSDADFALYIDTNKLGALDFDRVFAEVNEIIFNELKKIRDEFQNNPKKYFDFFNLDSNLAREKLKETISELDEAKSLTDPNNFNWYQTKFKQLQLLNERAAPQPTCPYRGQSDFRLILRGDEFVRLTVSPEINWIVNSDNRAIEATWVTDQNKYTKFALARSKVIFEVYFEKDGVLYRRAVVGELVDVSASHKKDAGLQHFVENPEKNAVRYSLAFNGQKLAFWAYSLSYLADDLRLILFDSILRPWDDAKYQKRIYRTFFLNVVEMLGAYGTGANEINEYVNDVNEKIVKPLETVFPLSEESSALAEQITRNVDELSAKWPALPMFNDGFKAFAQVARKIIDDRKEDDQEKFNEFLLVIKENLDIVNRLGQTSAAKFDIQEIYNITMDQLL